VSATCTIDNPLHLQGSFFVNNGTVRVNIPDGTGRCLIKAQSSMAITGNATRNGSFYNIQYPATPINIIGSGG